MLLIQFNLGISQSTPHPEFFPKYYFSALEPIKGGILPVRSAKILLKSAVLKNFSISIAPQQGFANYQFNLGSQLGYDTIVSINEMLMCSPFFAHNTEITNKQYKEFLADSNFVKSQMDYAVKQLFPDTMVWKNLSATADKASVQNPNQRLYFQSIAFDNYPIVGITQLQAKAYCQWLEQKIYGVLSESLNRNNLKIEIDLPTATEWMALYHVCIATPLQSTNRAKLIDLKRNFARPNDTEAGSSLINYLFFLKSPMPVPVFKNFNTNRGFVFQNPFVSHPAAARFGQNKYFPQISDLLGNVSEWTSTNGYNHLFNQKSFILNTQGQILPNAHQLPSVFDFHGYLIDENTLKNHFVIKGGSWIQEFHYLDPLSVEIKSNTQRTEYIGFRPVLRFYSTAN